MIATQVAQGTKATKEFEKIKEPKATKITQPKQTWQQWCRHKKADLKALNNNRPTHKLHKKRLKCMIKCQPHLKMLNKQSQHLL